MTASAFELAAMAGGCGAAALCLVTRDRRLRIAALALALALAPVLVGISLWNEPRVVVFREDTAMVASTAAVAAGLVAALALLFRRLPAAFAVLAITLLPLRVPVEIGGEESNLLIPLYAVIAGGAVAAVWAEAGGGHRRAGDRSDAGRQAVWRPTSTVGALRWLLAAMLILYAAQSSYTMDVSNALEVTGFFLLPFAAMLALLLEVEWSRRRLGLVLGGVGAMAAVFAGIAIYQYAARDLFLNPELYESNQLHQYFRVNSLFFDPNILGRYLALALAALAAYVAWNGERRWLAAAAALAAAAIVALAFSFSITSFAALIAGLVVLAALRFDIPGGAAAAGTVALAAAVVLVAGGAPTSDLDQERGIDSGRTDLVSGGIELARDRPLGGWGSGSFGAAFWDRIEQARTTISHSDPVTVAAEQGLVGLAVYLPLLAVSLLVLFAGRPGRSVGRSAVAACFVVMLVHSLGYAGFTTDPATWALLALGISLRDGSP